jgi:hypothetical protein
VKMKFNPNPAEFGILFVNRSESRCGSCNGGADPHEESHKTLLGWFAVNDALEGCGERYTAVSSDYWGMEADLAALRPDLPLIDAHDIWRKQNAADE